MALSNVVKELKSFEQEKGKKVLTIYLNTDRSECQNGSWKIRLKNGLKKLESYIEVGSDDKELKRYKVLKKKVEKTIQNSVTNLQKSVIIFASSDAKLFFVHFLQLPVETQFFWEDQPELNQIEQIQNDFPSSGVIIANDDELILMHSSLGELQVVTSFSFEAYTDDWRPFEGRAATEKTSSSANHKDHFQERYNANQQRWLRATLPDIHQVAKKFNWKYVNVIGQAEYLADLENELKLDIKNVLRKTFSSKDQNDLILKEIIAV